MTEHDPYETSLRTDFDRPIVQPFLQAVEAYRLIEPGDRIGVCISGGKDSMLMAKLLQMHQRTAPFAYALTYIVMDPGYRPENRAKIEHNARLLGIPITVFETNIFDVANGTEKSPCYLCARMRRGHLYHFAQQNGCNKIALGHHFSDVIETTLLAMFYGSQLQGMLPKLPSTNFDGMELIRPLYRVHEDSILAWRDANRLDFIQCACRFTEQSAATNGESSKRQEVKQLIRRLKQTNPGIEDSVFQALHNVSLDTFPAYKSGGIWHTFDAK